MLAPKPRPQTQKEKLASVAMITCQPAASIKISRLLSEHNIHTVHKPVKKNIHMVRPLNDKIGLEANGMCCVLYVGQTGRATESRRKRHARHTHLGQPVKSAVAEYKHKTGHNTEFSNTTKLDSVRLHGLLNKGG